MPNTKVSPYAAAADLVAYLRSARLGELINDDGTKTLTQTSTDALDEQLWRTSRVIHGYIGSSYACPQDETKNPLTFGALAEMNLAITAYRLFARGLVQGGSVVDLKAASDAAVAQLQKIQLGQAYLPEDAARLLPKAAASATSFVGGSEPQIYGDPDAET